MSLSSFIKTSRRFIYRTGRIKGPKSYDPFRVVRIGQGNIYNGPLTTKLAPRQFQKGYRDWKVGKKTKNGFRLYKPHILKKILNFNIPDLREFMVLHIFN